MSARYVFAPEIFDRIRTVAPSETGEIYLTEGIRQMIEAGRRVRAVRLRGQETRYDIGNHPAYFRTFIDFALDDPEWGEETARLPRQAAVEPKAVARRVRWSDPAPLSRAGGRESRGSTRAVRRGTFRLTPVAASVS